MKDLPYSVTTSKEMLHPAKEWCETHFGRRWGAIEYRDGNWTVFWAGTNAPKNYNWYFRYEKDFSWFLLRWL